MDYINLSSISLKLNNISITENNGYYISIQDKESIKTLSILDDYLSEHIHNYKRLVHFEDNVEDTPGAGKYTYRLKFEE